MNKVRITGLVILLVGLILNFLMDIKGFWIGASIGFGSGLLVVGKIKSLVTSLELGKCFIVKYEKITTYNSTSMNKILNTKGSRFTAAKKLRNYGALKSCQPTTAH